MDRRKDQLSPRASIVFHAMPDLTLRTNYGRAFRAPTLAELAINQQMYAATLMGNADLRAETLDTFEASVDFWPFDRRVRLTGTGFYNLAKNFINQELMFGSTSQFRNVGDARVAGFELEAAAQIPSINSSFDVAYQFLDAKALPYDGAPSTQLDYAPTHRALRACADQHRQGGLRGGVRPVRGPALRPGLPGERGDGRRRSA